jgi:hypothetical protein
MKRVVCVGWMALGFWLSVPKVAHARDEFLLLHADHRMATVTTSDLG